MAKLPLNKKIGILGGGQLARMLCQQGQKLGLQVHILSKSKMDPAPLVTPFWHKGSIDNKKAVAAFCKKMDVITFESEFANTKIMPNLKNKFYPSLKNISLLQDRLTQKQSLVKAKLPTSPFIHTSNAQDVTDFYNKHGAFVAKKRMFGYDGYGTFIVKNKASLNNFLKNKSFTNFIIEQFIPFKRELSTLCARSKNGDIQFFPLVESLQKEAKCFWAKGPIMCTKALPLQKKIKAYLKNINYVGVIAFELFETSKALYINEVAPRVHNTGHHSLDSCNIDQFTAHLYCLLGTGLPKITTVSHGFAMVNLVGSSHKKPQLNISKNARLHWYEKADNRPGRKMGHINTCSTSADKSLKMALNDLKGFKL